MPERQSSQGLLTRSNSIWNEQTTQCFQDQRISLKMGQQGPPSTNPQKESRHLITSRGPPDERRQMKNTCPPICRRSKWEHWESIPIVRHQNDIHLTNTLRKALTFVKTPIPPENKVGVIYTISCECGAVYIGETGQTLKIRKAEQ